MVGDCLRLWIQHSARITEKTIRQTAKALIMFQCRKRGRGFRRLMPGLISMEGFALKHS